MEDMDQTRAEALRTLRDSAQYGVAMFPDDAQEGNSASEAIVKARAAARRGPVPLRVRGRYRRLHGGLVLELPARAPSPGSARCVSALAAVEPVLTPAGRTGTHAA